MPSGSNLTKAHKNSMLAFDIEVTRTKSAETSAQQNITESPTHQNVVSDKSEKNDVLQRISKYGQPMVRPTTEPDNEKSPDLTDLEDGGNYPTTSRHLTDQFGSTHSLHRSETPLSMYSNTSASCERRQSDGASSTMQMVSRGHQHHNWTQPGGSFTSPGGGYAASGGNFAAPPDWSMLMSDTRLQNTEMRMSMQRVSDKVDQLLSRNVPIRVAEQDISLTDVKHELGQIKEQNKQIKDCLMHKQAGQAATKDHNIKPVQDETALEEINETKQAKLDMQARKLEELETKLKEKENKLVSLAQNYEQDISKLKEQLHVAGNSAKEMAKTEIRSELKKVMSSTAKVLHAQFASDESYSGDAVGEVITDTLRQIAVKLLEKYESDGVKSRSVPPVATVMPTSKSDTEQLSSGDEEWQEDDQ